MNPIIEKVLKLIELGSPGNGATVAESQSAMKKATELMEKHSIDASAVAMAQAEKGKKLTFDITQNTVIMHRVQRYDFDMNTATILMQCLGIKVVFSNAWSDELKKLSFCYILVGDAQDVTIGKHLIPIFVKAMRGGISRLLKERKEKWTAVVGRSYYDGLTTGYINGNIDGKKIAWDSAERKNKDAHAIVLVGKKDAINLYYEKEFPNARKTGRNFTPSDMDAFFRGESEGKTLDTTFNKLK